jgi:hypothetical protein
MVCENVLNDTRARGDYLSSRTHFRQEQIPLLFLSLSSGVSELLECELIPIHRCAGTRLVGVPLLDGNIERIESRRKSTNQPGVKNENI